MAEAKTRPTAVDVDAFLAGVEPASRRADAQAVREMLQRLSGEPAVMWGPSIVGFGRYRYRYDSGHEGDAPRVGFSPRKAALVLYVMGDFERRAELTARLGRHTAGKACLYIKRLAEVDAQVLESLVAESLAHMRRRFPDG